MNIKREFLYSDEKLIPLQLIRTNYGIAEANPSSDFENVEVEIRSVEIRFPTASSNIALVLENDEIVAVHSTSPGTYSIEVVLKEGHTYNVYIVSKEYEDGFIKETYTVTADPLEGVKLQLTYDETPQQIDLSVEGAMVESPGRDVYDGEQWFNYEGSYDPPTPGQLIWSSPLEIPGIAGGENTGLIYYRDVLHDMITLFETAGAGENVDISSIRNSLKAWNAHDDLVKYIVRLEADQLVSNVDAVEDLISYLRAGNIREGYVTLGYEAHEVVENVLTVMKYGAAERPPFINPTQGNLFNPSWNACLYQPDGGGAEGGSMYPYDDYYIIVNDRVNDQAMLEVYPNLFPLSKKFYGQALQATKLPSVAENPDGWSLAPGGGDYDGPIARRQTASFLAIDMRTERDRLNDILTEIGLSQVSNEGTRVILESHIRHFAEIQHENVLGYLISELSATDASIEELGDLTFITGSTTGDTTVYPQAQEAILQNIRYLRNLISSVDENMWTAMKSNSALMLASMIKIREELVESPETNTILNITNSTVLDADVEVLWMAVEGSGWTTLDTAVQDVGEDVKIINIDIPELQTVGKYMVLVRPKRIKANISDTQDDFVIVRDDLNNYQTANYFYGFNAQLYTPNNYMQGEQKVVVESKWAASDQYIKLSPVFSGSVEVNEDLKIDLWSNDFIPVMIEVDVVEQNALTLSYSMYAKKELNTETGLCVIYDYAGNVYKRLSLGRHSNPSTGNAIVEYRTPEDDTDDY